MTRRLRKGERSPELDDDDRRDVAGDAWQKMRAYQRKLLDEREAAETFAGIDAKGGVRDWETEHATQGRRPGQREYSSTVVVAAASIVGALMLGWMIGLLLR